MDEIKKQASILESKLAPLFAQAPHIPENGRQTLVSFAPWLALISGILGLMGLYGAYTSWQYYNKFSQAMGGFVQAFAGPTSASLPLGWYVLILVSLVTTVLSFMAYTGLTQKAKGGWDMLFYSQIVSFIGGILALILGAGGIIGTIIGALIGFYLLFEIRTYYK